MEMPTAVFALRRMRLEERRKLFYGTEAEWVSMMEAEWVDELKLDIETSREARRLTDGGDAPAAKEVKVLRIQAKVDKKAGAVAAEEAGGVKQIADGGEVSAEAAAEADTKAAEAAKAQANLLGLGNIPPEVMAAMAAKREVDAKLKREADLKKKGMCVACAEKPATQSCSRCMVSLYCGRGCQVAHWKAHKKPCKVACAANEAKAADAAAAAA